MFLSNIRRISVPQRSTQNGGQGATSRAKQRLFAEEHVKGSVSRFFAPFIDFPVLLDIFYLKSVAGVLESENENFHHLISSQK